MPQPDDLTVSVPLALALAGELDGMTLHLRVEDCAALLRVAEQLPWQNVHRVTLPSIEDFESVQDYSRRAHWNLWWPERDMGRLLDLAPTLRRRTVTLWVAPDDPDLHNKLAVGESLSLQMAVPLADPDCIDLADLNSLVSYVLLTGATRTVHIEPLASMVNTAAGREEQTLWDVANESVRHNLFVDDAGQVSVSARLAPTHHFGTLADLADGSIKSSAAYQRLHGYTEGLFRSQSVCSTCRAYPLCGGWLRYADPEYDCEVWQLVINSLQDAVGEREAAKALTQRPVETARERTPQRR